MSDTPVCDENCICSEPHGYVVVPIGVARKLERALAAEKEANAKHFQENNRRFQQLERALAFEVEQRCAAEDAIKRLERMLIP